MAKTLRIEPSDLDVEFRKKATLDVTMVWRNKETGDPVDNTGGSAVWEFTDPDTGTLLYSLSTVGGTIVLGGTSGTIRLIFSAANNITQSAIWEVARHELRFTSAGGVAVPIFAGSFLFT